MRRTAALLLFLLLAASAPAAEADNDPWAAFRFLMGEWTIDGKPGQELHRFVFQPELHGTILVCRGRLAPPLGPGGPPAVSESLMVVYPAGKDGPAKAMAWDREGRATPFTVQPGGNGKSLAFVSEPGVAGPSTRLTYTAQGTDRLTITRASGSGEPEMRPATARRIPRSNIGLDLPRGYVCYRASGPIVVDGKLDEAAWQNAPWSESFLDIEGNLKPVPRLGTWAKMLWDDEYFYVAANLEEPNVWGTLTKHDSVIFQDNDFEIFLDPDGDNHEYYEVEINALNTEWDLFLKKPYRDGGPAINEWEIPGLKTGVHVLGTLNDPRDKDQGWTVEFAIPWKVLAEYAHRPTPPRDGDQWRINFSRVEWEHEVKDGKHAKVPKRREDNWVWSPQGFVDMHRPEFWGFVQFATAPPGKASLRPDPFQTIRERLIDVYHAQREHHGKHKQWADRPETLNLDRALPALSADALGLRPTPEGFEATIRWQPPGGAEETWSINQESRIVRKP